MNLALVFAILLCSMARSCQQNTQSQFATKSQVPSLGPRIPPPDPAKYKLIRDAQDWRNPYLTVLRDGIELRSGGVKLGRRVVAPEKLGEELAALPLTAWPYGKVVAFQENSIRSGNDDQLIAENKTKAARVLKSLGLTVDYWP